MKAFRQWLRGVLGFRRVEQVEDLNAEMQAHFEMNVADRMSRGESREEAEGSARREFGDIVTVREVTTDQMSGEWGHQFVQDVRYGLRSLARVPAFATVAVLTLALGIGANTAIFSVVNGVLLKPLPFPKPQQLVYVGSKFPTMGFEQFPLDRAEYLELRERARSFSDVGAYYTTAVNVGAQGGVPLRVAAAGATLSLFNALGVHPEMGRAFDDQETLPNGPNVVVISDELWRTALGGRLPVVGEKLEVNGIPRTIVGVMPPDFDVHDAQSLAGARTADPIRIWLPLPIDPAQRAQYRGNHYLSIIGRLRDGVSLEQARSEMRGLVSQWIALDGGKPGTPCCGPGFVHAPDPQKHPLRYDGLQATMVGSIGRALWVLQAAVAFVLLIACANMANLLLVRAEGRHKEMALRAALGAGRGRLVRQWVAESLLLSVAGAVAGTALAWLALKTLVAAGSSSIPRADAIGLDARVLVVTLLIAVGTGVLFGLTPLLQLGIDSIALSLREAGSRTTAIGARQRVRRGLVIAEMGLAVMLVIGAGLLIRSFWNLMRVDSGFDRGQLTTFALALPPVKYADSTRRVAFYQRLESDLARVAGVQAVASMNGLPPSRPINANDTDIEGYEMKPNGPAPNVDYYQYTTRDYFSTMRIPVVTGRAFGPQDGAMSAPVAIINETFVKTFYPGQNPIGRRVKPSFGPNVPWFTVIGVAKDVKQGGVDSKVGTELYLEYEQMPAALGFAPAGMNLVVRSTRPLTGLAPVIRREVATLDPSLPIIGLRTMDEVFADSVSRQHFLATLLGVFATVALALAAIGTYGVLAYSVAERSREFGIRMALGGTSSRVLSLVLRQGIALGVVGVVVGLAGAVAVTRLASSLLFGVTATDPVTYAAVSAVILLVAVLACLIPARRATRVDPLVALRSD